MKREGEERENERMSRERGKRKREKIEGIRSGTSFN